MRFRATLPVCGEPYSKPSWPSRIVWWRTCGPMTNGARCHGQATSPAGEPDRRKAGFT